MRQPSQGPFPPGLERRAFLEAQPTYWLKRCYQLLRRTVDGELREYGITLSQRDVLLALWDEGPMEQRVLCERLGLEQSSVSRLVEGLVRRDLVAMDTTQADRRVRIATLTFEGRSLLQRTPGASELGGRVMLHDMPEAERQELVRLLRRCTNNLLDRQGSGDRSTDIE